MRNEKKDYRTVSGAGNVFAITARVGMAEGEEQGGKTVITSVDELLKFAKAVNAGDYDEKTDAVVVLDADLDLSGVEWTPIGQANASGDIEHCFSGKFYGNGHVISNLDFSSGYGKGAVGRFFG